MKTYSYSQVSQMRLNTTHPQLQALFRKVLSKGIIDVSILEGARDEATQNRYYREGRSKVRFPDGKHNIKPGQQWAEAVDAAPCINGRPSFKYTHCCVLAGVVLSTAAEMGIRIRWGGNWDMDGEPVTDQDFQDLVHYEYLGEIPA